MKYIQGAWLTGYVRIQVTGLYPERFFQNCNEHNIMVWNLIKHSGNTCSGNVKLSDVANVKKIRYGTDYKLTFTNKQGLPFLLKNFTSRKEVLIGLLLSIILIFSLSNIVWDIRVTGVPKELETKISDKLSDYGIYQGAWTFTLDSPSEIQQNLIQDIPELLWIGVEKQGTSILFEGVEKIVVEDEEVDGPRDVIATKTGVIENMYVSKGRPQVQVNDYVEPGDVLVSGKLGNTEDEEDDDDETNNDGEIVAAEADITAKTWYETEVTVPLNTNYEELTGKSKTRYHLKMGDLKVPIWGFRKPEFSNIQREQQKKDLYLFKWKLPFSLMETTLREKTYAERKRDKNDAVEDGIRQAKQNLQLKLGPEAEVTSHNILQERIDNGKVKLILYVSVEEDIGKHKPIDQGD